MIGWVAKPPNPTPRRPIGTPQYVRLGEWHWAHAVGGLLPPPNGSRGRSRASLRHTVRVRPVTNTAAVPPAGAGCAGSKYPMGGWPPIAVPTPAVPAAASACHRLRDGRPHQTQQKTVTPVAHSPPPKPARSW